MNKSKGDTNKLNDFKTVDFLADKILNLNGCACHDLNIYFKLL